MLEKIGSYTDFLVQVNKNYNLILKQYAPKISTYFSDMTAYINKEGNKYEFPSKDIHRTIINKLIINDQSLFHDLFTHIAQEYAKNEKVFKKTINSDHQGLLLQVPPDQKGQPKNAHKILAFVQEYEKFKNEVEHDINEGVRKINIDNYMKELKIKALREYDDLFTIE